MRASLKDCRGRNGKIQNESFSVRYTPKGYKPNLQMNEGKLDAICFTLMVAGARNLCWSAYIKRPVSGKYVLTEHVFWFLFFFLPLVLTRIKCGHKA